MSRLAAMTAIAVVALTTRSTGILPTLYPARGPVVPGTCLSRYGGARAADPDDGGVRQIGLKAVFGAQPARQRLQQAHRDLELGPAFPAHEMAVAVRIREMPARH